MIAFNEQGTGPIREEQEDTEPKLRQVVKAIIKQGEKYLIVQKPQTARYFPSYWDFPGGKLEPEEDATTGLQREILEETGATAKIGGIQGTYELDLDDGGKKDHRFTVYSAEIDTDPEINSGIKWATKEEILKLPVEPYMKMYFEGTND